MESYSGKRYRTDDTGMQADNAQSWQAPPRKRKEYEPLPPNHILLVTILNPVYPITVEVLHAICSPHSRVLRIVTFQKTGMQAMIEFESVEGACSVREAIDGADIYSGCCTVRAEFAKPTRLNVFRNDSRTWDYTIGPAVSQDPNEQMRKAPLLPEPGYAAQQVQPVGPPVDGYGDGRGGPSMGQAIPVTGGDMYGQGAMNKYGGQPQRGPMPSHPGAGAGGGGNYAVSAGIYRAAQEYSRNSGAYGQDMYTLTTRDDRRAPVMAQQGTVLMVYGLNAEKMNPARLFNLFCLYGNIARIKFLRSKEGTAMVQMEDTMGLERAMTALNRLEFMDNRLQVTHSKQPYLNDVADPHTLPDGSSCFADYTRERNNRYLDQKSAMKNRIVAPSHILHFYNVPPNITAETMTDLLARSETPAPQEVRIFPARSARSSAGLMEFATAAMAIEALVMCNHIPVPHTAGGQPYTMKLCFSSARSIGGGRDDEGADHFQ